MPLPVSRNYSLVRGQTWRCAWRFLADDEAIDFTGYNFHCQIRDGLGRAAVLVAEPTVTVASNRVQVELSAAQTAAISQKNVFGDLWAVDTLGKRWPYVSFSIDVNRAMTEIA